MNLKELLNGIKYDGKVIDCEIEDISIDSRKVKSGTLFVCIKGVIADGHDYYLSALNLGAACIVTEKDLGIENQIIVENSRRAYAKICSNFFGNPADKLKIIGVTGTNGKTTVTSIVKQILSFWGLKVGLIGTIQYEIHNKIIQGDKTTPDAYVLYNMFAKMVEAGCEYVVMEVSSHALDQYRLGEIEFETAVFTNLSQDHLDYHENMEEYFLAKKKLFTMSKSAIINADDHYGQRLLKDIKCPVFTYSIKDGNIDFYADDIECTSKGVEFYLKYKSISSKVHFCMPGMYSVQNALAAAAVCLNCGMCMEKVITGLNSSKGVRGRSEIIDTGRDFTVICDYAHTPDGLENILPSIKEYATGRLVTLFGCGGDRDSSKRPIMGSVAAKYSDFLIITSDNPRTENPDKIISDILEGVKDTKTPYRVITNRQEAIFYAIKTAKTDDIIILAGKGHENYQVLDGEIIDFDERVIIRQALDSTK